jgi:ABC-type uncharacterized transport system permease subunit
MAVSTAQRKMPPPTSKFRTELEKLVAALGRPLFAVLLALVVAGIVTIISTQGPLLDRLNGVGSAYYYLYQGSFGTLQSTARTLVKVTALVFTGLSVALAFRAGLFNIGAAGQLTAGTVTAGAIALALPTQPGWILMPLMIIGSALAGAIWGGVIGALKAWRGAHEVVTSIMLNWIAFFLAAFLIDGPLQAPNLPRQSMPMPTQAILPFVSTFYNQTLGTFLPPIPTPTSYTVDLSIILALLMLVVYGFIVARTTFGYEIRVIGQNIKAARYAGISIQKNLILTMALAGALAGLAGSMRLMGQAPYQLVSSSFANDTTGFDAIGVALLGRTTPLGILLAALLFGGLQQAGPSMELFAHVPASLVYIIEALVLLSVATEFLPALQRVLPGWMRWGQKPVLLSPVVASSPTTPRNNEDDTQQAIQQQEPGDKTVAPAGQEE